MWVKKNQNQTKKEKKGANRNLQGTYKFMCSLSQLAAN